MSITSIISESVIAYLLLFFYWIIVLSSVTALIIYLPKFFKKKKRRIKKDLKDDLLLQRTAKLINFSKTSEYYRAKLSLILTDCYAKMQGYFGVSPVELNNLLMQRKLDIPEDIRNALIEGFAFYFNLSSGKKSDFLNNFLKLFKLGNLLQNNKSTKSFYDLKNSNDPLDRAIFDLLSEKEL